MLNFREFRSTLSEALAHKYIAGEAVFKEKYKPYRLDPRGIVTHVYNSLNDEIATYNHELGVLSTNRYHDDLTEI